MEMPEFFKPIYAKYYEPLPNLKAYLYPRTKTFSTPARSFCRNAASGLTLRTATSTLRSILPCLTAIILAHTQKMFSFAGIARIGLAGETVPATREGLDRVIWAHLCTVPLLRLPNAMSYLPQFVKLCEKPTPVFVKLLLPLRQSRRISLRY